MAEETVRNRGPGLSGKSAPDLPGSEWTSVPEYRVRLSLALLTQGNVLKQKPLLLYCSSQVLLSCCLGDSIPSQEIIVNQK